MKLCIFSKGEATRLGIATDRGVVDVRAHLPEAPETMLALIEQWADWRVAFESCASAKADYGFDEIVLRAPLARPGKILCIGLNYADHIEESGMETPKDQLWFSKPWTSIADPFGGIDLPRVSSALDYEAELVCIIGKTGRHVSRADAPSLIFGFCCGNDVSVRDWQFKTSQFFLGKSFDTHAPIGPWIVTSDSLDPHGLDIQCFVNGEQRQSSNTKHLIFDCYAQIEHVSKVMTLEPGDIIFTGTPDGVGAVKKPPLWLKAGDLVTVQIEGIGSIENRVRAEPPGVTA